MTFIKNPINFFKRANKTFTLYLKIYKKINHFLSSYQAYQNRTEKLLIDNKKRLTDYKAKQDRTENFLVENKKNFNDFLKSYNQNQKKLNQMLTSYDKNQSKINDFIFSYSAIKHDINKSVAIFNKNYEKSKEYFFNGDEQLFKLDTDRFFQMCFLNNFKLLSYSPAENKIYLKTDDGIILSTNNRYYTIEEIFARNGYSIPQLYMFEEFVVFDIGMNRGYASLKFANFESCKAVYGFEINEDTYDFAIENFNLNPKIKHKITPYKFGLSDVDEEVDLYCLTGSDGVSTTELEFTDLQSEWINGKENMKIKRANVKSAGSVLSDIIEDNDITSKIVLKIDTEGSEYKIIDDLKNKGVLDRIDLIFGESHLDSEDLEGKLVGFKEISRVYHSDIIFSFCYVKEELLNELPLAKF